MGLAWIGIFIIFAFMRATVISIPFERDEGGYAYIAQQMLQGGVPYRDAFDQKPPGIYLFYYIAFVTMGQSVEAVHLLMHLWMLLGAFLLYRLVSRLSGVPAGLMAALIFVVITAEKGVLGSTANSEMFMLTPIIGSLLCIMPRAGVPGIARLVGAGALAASAIWIKQVALTNALFLCVWIVISDLRAWNKRGLLVNPLCLLIGAVAASIPVFLYFIATGTLHEFLDCVFIYNFNYATSELNTPMLLLQRFWASMSDILIGDWPFWLAAMLAVFVLQIQRQWKLLAFYLGLLVCSAAGVSIGGYFRPHYFMQITPAVAAIAGVGLANLASGANAIRIALLRITAIAVGMLLILAVPVRANWGVLFAPNVNVALVRIYGWNQFIFAQEMAASLREGSAPDETILVAGTEPEIAFYAQRKNATRFIYWDPLAAKYPKILDSQRQAIEEIRQNKPRYIIDQMFGFSRSIMKPGQTEMYFFNELAKYTREQGYQAVDFWLALGEGQGVPSCYLRLNPKQADDLEKQAGQPLNWMIVMRRPDEPPRN